MTDPRPSHILSSMSSEIQRGTYLLLAGSNFRTDKEEQRRQETGEKRSKIYGPNRESELEVKMFLYTMSINDGIV